MQMILFIVLPVLGILLGWTIRWVYARFQLSASEQKAERVKQDAIKEAEAQKKEILLQAKEQLIQDRNQQEKENRERRTELQRYESRVSKKEELIDQRSQEFDRKEKEFALRVTEMEKKEAVLSQEELKLRSELERISGLTAQEAKNLIIQNLENEARHDAQSLLNKIDQEAQLTAEKKAQEILVSAIQRIATEATSDITVATVSLPSDEMKGRIIGREGRNIRSLETLTGVDVIIDDTPEAVVISCFDPVRKEIARIALERLIIDGRIHPARIEEVVQKVTREIQQKIYEEGEKALYDLGIHNMSQDAVRAIGRLYFRTSYGQNVLTHSKEVAELASLLAAEVGANRELAKRAALLHDIGKGAENDSDQNHAEVGAEMARKMGEDPRVINAIASHHNDCEPETLEAILVQIADAISAARPGARRETVDNYVKRLENLEETAKKFVGVEQAYAIQAGRELRILVNNDKIPDAEVKDLAKQIAKQIETDLRYPGRIKITMIRETRIIEYAR
ncbi:MAG: ribonuclease Y [Treponema sp.]|nr:ribonuclease Y [Spirochaetia bacterium]MDD7579386.1 ribonuclease Y [Treponema sp.]MCI7440017.1 ribonuclease Y [Spirochaetia bacterium]MDY3759371.1 ribonuclease Y [Treponema sp.]MDY4130256.1 ribonuclease Y [Treponema sp.]